MLQLINEFIPRDVTTSAGPLQVLHRRIEAQDVFYVFNPAGSSQTAEVGFRATGTVEEWDPWTAAVTLTPPAAVSEGVSTLRMTLRAREARVIVFQPQASSCLAIPSPGDVAVELQRFDGPWNFTVRPTLDNRFGDFRLPASAGLLPPEAGRFKWAEETTPGVTWHDPAFDDSLWPETTYSFGPRFEVIGPLPPGTPCQGLWRPYAFSLRWGIERDPFLTDWLNGPHGLKNKVPDEFLDFHCNQPGSEWHLRASVAMESDQNTTMLVGGRCAYQAWLNEQLVLEQVDSLPPARHTPWNIPHYECVPGETRVRLLKGENHLRLKLVQPEGQRTRAFVAFDPPPASTHVSLRWFTQPHVPRPALLASPERRATWLRCVAPPGLRGLQFVSRGPARVWADGQELAVQKMKCLPDGCIGYLALTSKTHPDPILLAWRIEAAREFRAGDVLPEPVRFDCSNGRLLAGDWCASGLAVYSGIGEYQRSFEFPEWPRDGRIVLDLGDVSASAEVRLNGIRAGVLTAPPWRVESDKPHSVGQEQSHNSSRQHTRQPLQCRHPDPLCLPTPNQIGPVRPGAIDTRARHVEIFQ